MHTTFIVRLFQYVWELISHAVILQIGNSSITLRDVLLGGTILFFLTRFVNWCTGGGLYTFHGMHDVSFPGEPTWAGDPSNSELWARRLYDNYETLKRQGKAFM